MWHLLPGDNVELIPAPMAKREYEAYIRARPALDRRTTSQVVMAEGDYVTVGDGIFVEWARRKYALPIFDDLGQFFPGRPAAIVAMNVGAGARDCAVLRCGTCGCRTCPQRRDLEGFP
jgi:hypothetical protein